MKYRPDFKSTGHYMKTDAKLKSVLKRQADKGADYARANAARETGEHASSIHVEDAGIGGKDHDRMEIQVVADSPHSALVEFGSAKTGRKAGGALRSAIPIIEGA